ncbi:putative multidrug export ATP-binding/permease protein YgaD [Clostridium zeae]|uniref:Multidrug export ATP-binding/permease protein YgaD n=1 Tax=Clostridium zeae TaxID=2759022 RepID=A0ABQ1EEF8_9CLOT|nr:ABC transporter ATP-binding protein [Clostridium zeae]GFZ33073.1 putative multidrug export ATP-binding/permease protein YgaD [Clostridium zeae]
MSKDTLQNNWSLLRRAFIYVHPVRRKFFAAFFCILVGIAISIVQPLVWAKLIVTFYEKDFYLILRCVLYLMIIFLVQTISTSFQTYLFSFLTQNIVYDIKRDMYKKILDLPIKAFDEMRTGDFISRLNGDANTLANIIINQLLNTIIDVIKVAVIGIVVFRVNVLLSLVVLVSFPISLSIFVIFGGRLRDKSQELAKLNDDYYSDMHASILGIREIKSLGIKQKRFESFMKLSSKLKVKTISITTFNTFLQALSQCIDNFSQFVVILVGGYLIFSGALTVEYFIAFSSYSQQFSSSLMNITRLNSNIQQALTSLDRIFSLMDNLNYDKEELGTDKIDTIKGDIYFKNLSFSYEKDKELLKDVSFHVTPNTKVAIVGRSGSGKSTIFNLILRFYELQQGKIFIDNIDIKNFDEDSIRKHVSIVRQDPFLFNMSIKDNLSIVNEAATDEEIINSCKLAYIHEFISSLPNGYDTIVGDNGVNLSGGQKQKIAIARALIKKSKIILFDEATSSLDNDSQYHIKEAIDRLLVDHTVITIAHRLLTVIEADEIVVLEGGQVVGAGTHQYLFKNNSVYKNLYETEFSILNEKKVVS